MQSSCNLIKNSSALKSSKKIIETNYRTNSEVEEIEDEQCRIEYEIKKNYETLGANIIKKAKLEAEEIMIKSRKMASEVEKIAYEEGYKQGKSNGFEDGYNEGLEKVRRDTEQEIRINIEKSEEILKKANEEYKEYLLTKEKEIIKLAFNMASIIAKRELEASEGIITLIENILEEAKGEENIIIRCNNVHVKDINEKINYYKKAYAIKGEIFILEDTLMEPGNAVIDKGTGKAFVGLDVALEKLENELFK
ncbi:flagellar biosynthesis/type III secretory pathway-like protein [Clostridium sp. AL.422]|uniref:FliH/SctL family protein n=1 Tax=Clostridium TaxID=1485 RepID=UPI00293DE2C4|nr:MULTISPECIES: FliH/SctL family protein [unclassified Clostridium]MDV4149704.1 flagellar biosynthesis/type III secretory pathway-like protein [Clostridium sp. AL.422]